MITVVNVIGLGDRDVERNCSQRKWHGRNDLIRTQWCELMLGEEPKLSKDESVDPNKTKAARKGVGYSAKQGEIFNVGEYLENKKQRNDQIVILIDICTNLFDSEEWEASSEIVEQILKSALLPILESAFRNGSFLDMAKEAQVYHSYCGKHYNYSNFFQLSRALSLTRRTLLPA